MTAEGMIVNESLESGIQSASSTDTKKYYIKNGTSEITDKPTDGFTPVGDRGVQKTSDGNLWFVGAAPDGLDGAPMEDIAALFRQQEEAKRTKEHTADTAYAKNIKDNQSDQLTSLYETFLGKNDIEQIKQAKEQTELVRKLSPNAEVLEEVQNINNQIFTQQRLFFNEVNQQEQKNTIGEKIRSLRAQKLVLLTKEIQRLQTADLDRHTLAPLGMKVNTRLVDAEFSFKPGVTLNMKKLRKKHRVNNIVSSLNFVNQSNRGNAKKMSEEGIHRVMSYRKNHDRWPGSAVASAASSVKNRIFRGLSLDRPDEKITEKFNQKKKLIAETLKENGLPESSPLYPKIMARVEAYRQLYLKHRVEKIQNLA